MYRVVQFSNGGSPISYISQKIQLIQVKVQVLDLISIFWFRYDLRQKYYAPQVRLAADGVQSYDRQIMDTYVPETLVLTTEPPGTILLPNA